MFAGAVAAGVLVAYEASKRHAQLAAAAARNHESQGLMRLSAFIAFAVVFGLVTFTVATALVWTRARRRGGRIRTPASQRYRGYGGGW